MQRLDFYFDPCCPFCWITSRWLLQVSEERAVDITWRPFSLAEKNDELAGGSDASALADMHREAHRVHRVIGAAVKEGASTIELYSAFGRPFHLEQRSYDDALIAEVLQQQGLSADLAKAADDASWDSHLATETQSAVDAVGEDTGVPTIVFETDGEKKGYYGPVLNAMPSKEEGLAIWDGLTTLAPVTAFYELKRTRPEGMPDTSGTKGL